jgi:hypothetical protein
MKKSLLLLGAILIVGCSTDSANTSTETNCDCGVVVQSTTYNIPDGNGGVITASNFIVRNNCTQLTKNVYNVSGTIVTGTQWCN